MKKILLLAVVPLLVACSTMALTPGSTPEQKQQALCSDAMLGIAQAQIALAVADLTPLQRDYWDRWLGAALLSRDLYCNPQAGPPGAK